MSPKKILLEAAKLVASETSCYSCTAIDQISKKYDKPPRRSDKRLSKCYARLMSPIPGKELSSNHIYEACDRHLWINIRKLRVLLLLMFLAAYDDLTLERS